MGIVIGDTEANWILNLPSDKLPKYKDPGDGQMRVLTLEDHMIDPSIIKGALERRAFTFEKAGKIKFPDENIATLLVEEMLNGKWLVWGGILMYKPKHIVRPTGVVTAGTYYIHQIFSPEVQRIFTDLYAPAGKSYFESNPAA